MQRRTFLALAGASIPATLAGCTENESSDRQSGDDSGSGDGDGPVQFVDHEWYNSGAYEAGVTGQLENVSGDTLSYVEVSVYFLDEEGTQFEEGLDNTSELADGRTWEFDAMFLGDEPDRVDDYEIEWEVTDY
ncbi:hypothetical protein C479_10685 [Halovivax asiaticus JCM 14624]|uniref:Lipoprotein n=1 Tax=Halovivax asiaticus JCM 14624 TaxID=1227490 RepID=M0BEF8_9EURY|nr:FxLYD domain-containing protein [Halovivax asiaticus]ELZ09281.1 hypothetical protein C479_10685 [Halovivax asiaticus JCM 14624]